MLNGRNDFAMPPGTFQKPMFRLLGSPEQDKRLIQFDTGHVVPLKDAIPEVLNWLDRYLGPVETRQRAGIASLGSKRFVPAAAHPPTQSA